MASASCVNLSTLLGNGLTCVVFLEQSPTFDSFPQILANFKSLPKEHAVSFIEVDTETRLGLISTAGITQLPAHIFHRDCRGHLKLTQATASIAEGRESSYFKWQASGDKGLPKGVAMDLAIVAPSLVLFKDGKMVGRPRPVIGGGVDSEYSLNAWFEKTLAAAPL